MQKVFRVISNLLKRNPNLFWFSIRSLLLRQLGQNIHDSFEYIDEKNCESRLGIEIQKTYPLSDLGGVPSTDNRIWASKPIDKRHLFRMIDGRVETFSGKLFTSNGVYVADSSPWNLDRALVRWPMPYPKAFNSKATRVLGPATFLPSQSFYHFLFEDLPSLVRVREFRPDVRVCTRTAPASHIKSFLGALGIEVEEIPGRFVIFDDLFFETRGPALVPQILDVETLRKAFGISPIGEIPSHLVSKDKRLYISRKDRERIPSNEAEVEALLVGMGFEVVVLDRMSAQEQVDIFIQAKTIVGVHGAGLSNIVWAPPNGTKVLELRRRRQPQTFEILCSLVKADYLSLESDESEDWCIDLETLSNLVVSLDS